VHVVADGGRADAEVAEEFGGLAGVFAGDAVDRAQDAERAEGDVFEVADGRGDEVEAGGERFFRRGRLAERFRRGVSHAAPEARREGGCGGPD